LAKNGKNILPKAEVRPMWLTFVYCFTSGFSPLLLIAFAVVFITYIPFGVPPSNIYNLALAIVLLVVVFISGLFTFVQEVLSTIALFSFQDMVSKDCIVIRDGSSQSIPRDKLVVGDIVLLGTGTKIPADVRIVSAVVNHGYD
jgi:magnesium-transporting ATPase (P-type)